MTGRPRHSWYAAILAACVVALAYDLDGYPLLDPDEGRNAEVAREMASTGDFVLPRLNGLPYLDKPVLFFAVGAGVMKVLGPSVLAARLPPLVFTLATLAVVFWFGRRLYGRDGAWIATIATAATPFAIAYARTVIFDSALTFFVVVALVAFYLAVDALDPPSDDPAARTRSGWWATLAWAAMALGVLTKGPVALAIPLLVAIPYAVWRRAARVVLDPVGVLLLGAIVAPWVLLVQREVPDFLQYAVVTETARRLLTDELQRTGPFWYFLPLLPAAALPWSVVAGAGLWATLRNRDGVDRRTVFLALWIVAPLILFTLSHSKRPQYVLPLIPAVALLAAAAWVREPERPPGRLAGAVTLAGLAVFLLVGHPVIPKLVSASPDVAEAIPATALGLGVACAAASALVWSSVTRPAALLAGLALPVAAIPFVSRDLMDAIGNERSSMHVARAIEPHLTPGMRVVGVRAFPLSLPFYLRQTIILSTADGTELTSNYLIRHLDRWSGRVHTLQPADWWREASLTCSRPSVFVFNSDDRDARRVVDERLPLLIDNGKYSAYGPCGVFDLAGAAH